MSSGGEPGPAKESDKKHFSVPEDAKPVNLETIDLSVLMVKIRRMSFSYDRFTKGHNILEDINMSFPKSTIYGLLGPSGCGKTTLLKLILGMKKAKTGTILVNGRKTSDIETKIPGYGETALYKEFTIKETLEYWAALHGMERGAVDEKIQFLKQLLDLPDHNMKIKELSGGQQRRVSLAVTLSYESPFLMLDEPTVGVDPVLREKIWTHLVELSNNKKTSILITTHYVEEALRAHVVALMREGHLLVEQSPDYLLDHFKVDTLEDMFVKVCEAQDTNKPMPKSFIEHKRGKQPQIGNTIGPPVIIPGLSPSVRKRFTALTWKNCIRIRRQYLMLLLQIVSPALSMSLFLICIGDIPEDIPVAVYNGEKGMSPTQPNECNLANMGQIFLENINRTYIKLEHKEDTDKAIDSVRNGDTYGALIIDRDFSRHLCHRMNGTVENINGSTIVYYGDLTDITIHTTIDKELRSAQLKFINDAVNNSNNKTYHLNALKPFLEIVKPRYGREDISFRDFMTPGMIISTVFILAAGLTTLSFVTEKREGVLERNFIASVSMVEVLSAQIFIQIFVLLLQVGAIFLIISEPFFDTKNEGSYLLAVIIIVMQGLLGMIYGLCISIIASDEQSALMIAFGSFFPILLLSGIFWPIEGMPWYFQKLSYLMPQTTAVMSLRYILMKGWNLTNIRVWLGYISTSVWFIALVLASVVLSSIWT